MGHFIAQSAFYVGTRRPVFIKERQAGISHLQPIIK